MQKTRHTRPKRTQRNRKNISTRAKQSVRLSKRRISGAGTSHPSSSRISSSHFLSHKLKSVKVHLINDGSLFDNTRYSSITAETALVNLYKCLHQTGKLKEKNWTELPSLTELKNHLFEEMNRIAPKNSVCRYKHDEDGKLRLLFYKGLNDLEGNFNLPLEWLPEIEKKNGELYNIVLWMLAAVAGSWHLDIIENNYNNYMIDAPAGHFEDYEELDKNPIKDYQKGGPAYRMRELIRGYSRKFSTKILVKAVNSFVPNTTLETKIHRWMLKGLLALESPRSIGYYFYRDMMENDEDPVQCNDMYGYVWSFNDIVFNQSEDMMNDVAANSGIVPPIILTELFPNKKPETGDGEKPLKQLYDFLQAGRSIYWQHFDKKYEKLHSEMRHNY